MRVSVPAEAEGGRLSAAEKLWKAGRQAFRNRDYALAESLFGRIIVEFGEEAAAIDSAELRLLIGITRLRLQRTEDGVADLERAVELAPARARAHYKLGLGLARLRRHDEALERFVSANELEADNIEYLLRLGLQHRRMNQLEKAASTYHQILSLDPTHSAARMSLKLCSDKAAMQDSNPESTNLLRRMVAKLCRIVSRRHHHSNA